jgi:two-component system phosphate regulon response regulator PhoB
VLVVDDEPANLMVMEGALEGRGYDVIPASSAAEAHETARNLPPDLVLLDVMMPEVSGVELCRRWRTERTLDHTPIILITALSADEHRVAGLGAGADDFIEKPIDVDTLIRRTSAWLAVGRQPEPTPVSPGGTTRAERLLMAASGLASEGDIRELATAMARAAHMHDVAAQLAQSNVVRLPRVSP